MSAQEDFCRTIIVAARKVGMGCRLDVVDGKTKATFMDPMSMTTIHGELAEKPQDALESACRELVKFWDVKK